jgi:hypothetical protein
LPWTAVLSRSPGASGGTLYETTGTLSFARGSRIATTGGTLALTTNGTLTRSGSATLVFVPTAGSLGLASATNSQRVFVDGGTVVTNGMLPAYFVSSTDNQFLTYGTYGFTHDDRCTHELGRRINCRNRQSRVSLRLQRSWIIR